MSDRAFRILFLLAIIGALVSLVCFPAAPAEARSCPGSPPPIGLGQGCYVGNGNDGRQIPTGIDNPGLVLVYKVSPTADTTDATYRTDTGGAGDASCLVGNAGAGTCGVTNRIQAIADQYFEVGTNDAVNTTNDPYCWFAWALGEHFVTLTWTGDGSSPRTIPLPAGFTAAAAAVQLDGTAACFGSGNVYIRTNDMPATYSFGWWNVGEAPRTNIIINLPTEGIEVQGCANETGKLYRAWAWEAAPGYGDAITFVGNGNGDNCALPSDQQVIDAGDGVTNVITVGCQGNVATCGAEGLACVAASHTGVTPAIRGTNMGVDVTGAGETADDFVSICSTGGLCPNVLGELEGNGFTVAGSGSFGSNLNDEGLKVYAWVTFQSVAPIATTSLQDWCNDTDTVACYSNTPDSPGGFDFDIGANQDCSPGSVSGGTTICGHPDCDCNLAVDGVTADPTNTAIGTQSAAYVEADNDFMSCAAADCSDEFLLGQSGASFTLMCHIRSTLDADQTYINKNGTTAGVYQMGRVASGDELLCTVKNTSGTAITDLAAGLTINDFHFGACVFDNASDTVEAYLDGAFTGSPATILTDAQGGSGDFCLGCSGAVPAGDLTGNTNHCVVFTGVASDADLCRSCSCGWRPGDCQCWLTDPTQYVDEGVNDTLCGNCTLPDCDKGAPD